MKLLVGLFIASFAVSSYSTVGLKRVTDRANEEKQISKLISNVNAEGGCEDIGRAQFDDEVALGSRCGGHIVKKQSGSYKSVSVLKTRCKNILVGFNKVTRYGRTTYEQVSNEGTRLYQMQFTQDDKIGSGNVRINNAALRSGGYNDTYVIVTSNSGKSCYAFEARF